MKPGHGEVLIAEGDVELAEDEQRLIEEFRRQLDGGLWAAVPTLEADGRRQAHMVRSFEDAGAAAVHIEDQLLPKKCGHLNDKKLADAHDMAAKIAAARRARRHLFIVARTDAAASEGMDGAVARAKLYLEAGADAIFPEALITAEMFRTFADRVKAPLLANMTEFGRTPFFTAAEFQDMGYRMVIWPVSSLRVANKAQAELYAAIRRDDGAQAMVDRMQTRAELYAAIGYHDYEALDATIVKTVIPEGMPQRRSP